MSMEFINHKGTSVEHVHEQSKSATKGLKIHTPQHVPLNYILKKVTSSMAVSTIPLAKEAFFFFAI